MGEYRHEVPLTVLAMLITIAGSAMEVFPIVFTGWAVNYLQAWYGTGRLNVWPFVILIALAALVRNLLRFAQSVGRAELSVRITNRLRHRMYEAVQRHSLTYHSKTTTGDLISRSTGDVEHMSRFIRFSVFGTAEMLIVLGVSVVTLLSIDVSFAVIALSPVPLAVYLTVRFGSRMRPMWRGARDAYGEVTTVLQENIAGARVVRAFAQEQAESEKFGGRTVTYIKRVIDAFRYWVVRMVSTSLAFSMVTPIAVLYGSYAAIRGGLGIGDILICLGLMRPIERRLHHIMHLIETYQRAAAGGERVFEVLDEEPSIQSHPGAQAMPRSSERKGACVEFGGVSFGYEPDKPVIADVSFTAQSGQTIAVVGHTGSGKSTLISLIPRFHDPTAGVVLINSKDARDIRLDELRQAIGIIFQETFLFSASVRGNIAYGLPDADEDAIRAAAQAAKAHDFIMELDDGYDTIIGERGVTLSGGQAQRIAIARAVLLDPDVLIMDDATASVDSETERHIRETMRQVAEGRTNFIVAHRVSSVAHADQILVLEEGRIAEQGTHTELYNRGGIYRRMCEQQFAGRIDED